MPPSENQQRCVMFVCAKRGEDDDDEPSPVGTAFLAGVPDGQAGWHKYL